MHTYRFPHNIQICVGFSTSRRYSSISLLSTYIIPGFQGLPVREPKEAGEPFPDDLSSLFHRVLYGRAAVHAQIERAADVTRMSATPVMPRLVLHCLLQGCPGSIRQLAATIRAILAIEPSERDIEEAKDVFELSLVQLLTAE